MKVLPHKNIIENCAFSSSKGLMDGYPYRSVYKAIANNCQVGVNQPKQQNIVEVLNAGIR